MKAEDYVTRWHPFTLQDGAVVIMVGKPVREIKHYCIQQQKAIQARTGLGPGFFGSHFSGEAKLDTVELYQPIEESYRSGYCNYCNILWVAEYP